MGVIPAAVRDPIFWVDAQLMLLCEHFDTHAVNKLAGWKED